MIDKKIEDIVLEDIVQLVENDVRESRTLEYKALVGTNPEAKKEFSADVSSFANAIGGDLLIGIGQETDGSLKKEIGLEAGNVDAEITRLSSIIRDGIRPRMKVDIKSIEVESSPQKYIIIVRIAPSTEKPYQVISGGHDKFYTRNSSGKHKMDLDEIRDLFVESSEVMDKIRNFRFERLKTIQLNEAPINLSDTLHTITIHTLPLQSFYQSAYGGLNNDEISQLSMKQHPASPHFEPPSHYGYSHLINLDGVVVYYPTKGDTTHSYTQLWRNGRIESFLSGRWEEETGGIYMASIEEMVIKTVSQHLSLLSALNISGPYFVFFTLMGVKGHKVKWSEGLFPTESRAIRQNILPLPEVIFDEHIEQVNLNQSVAEKFGQVFDMVWNASGISRSLASAKRNKPVTQ